MAGPTDRLLSNLIFRYGSLSQWGFVLLMLVILTGVVAPLTVHAGSVAEEFAGKQFKSGTLVSIAKNDPNDIELASVENSDYLLGVVNSGGTNLLTFSKNGAQVAVAISGVAAAYVNDANGLIKKGDFIGASWLQGVGMKAQVADQRKLVGIALEDFNVATATDYGEINTPSGKLNVKVGSIAIRLFDRENAPGRAQSKTGIESFVNKIAGKEVSMGRLIAGALLFLLTVIVTSMFIFTAIRGSFISIGRNPMASDAIYSSLLHVSSISIGIILVGTILSYLVLVV